jgi:16S rRNA (cytosine967-C5)-methyltransferase
MKPSARVQAAIELLDEIIVAARDAGPAADTIINSFFQRRRYAGSGDRRAIRELVYRVIRRSGERPVSGRAAMIGLGKDDPDILELFDWSLRAPAPPLENEPFAEAVAIPDWLVQHLDPLVDADEVPALLDRAPLDVRVNMIKGDRAAALEALPEASPTNLSPIGLILPDGFMLDNHPAWQSGLVEVQDEGSQIVALACSAAPGETVIDLCAGAGGKTLAFAAAMANRGRLIASDVDRPRLSRIDARAQRAGATIIEKRLLNPGQERKALADVAGKADVVLIDAPCSGSGTWRRNPETRWRLKPERLAQIMRVQAHLLDLASELVRPGGRVIYAVCSILADEGRLQAHAFAERRSSFISEEPPIGGGRPCGAGRLLTPRHDGTDGFFIARWQAA